MDIARDMSTQTQIEGLSFSLKRSSLSKYIRIVVNIHGECNVTAPKRVSEELIYAFIRQKYTWIQKKIQYFKARAPILKEKISIKDQRAAYIRDKEEARLLIHSRLEYFASIYNVTYNTVRIKDTKGRWGSCSKKKNLNFSYKLLHIPRELCDYVIVHEVCHLMELNHSANFWNLVAQTIPDYKERRRELQKRV